MNSLLLVLLFAVGQANAAKRPAENYRISGVVVDANSGAPVSHAQMSISSEGDQESTTADDTGRFLFEGLRPGKYSLVAQAHGCVTQSYDQHGQFSTAIVVGPGLDSEHIVFRLPRQGVIYGAITDEHGDGVRNAPVLLFEEGPPGSSQKPTMGGQTQTNDLGQYRFAHLNEGRYFVAVQARPWYAESGPRYTIRNRDRNSSSFSFTRITPSPPNPLLDVVYPITFYPGVSDPAIANELHITAGDQEEADIQLIPVPDVHVLVTGLPEHPPNGPYNLSVSVQQNAFGSPIPVWMNGATEVAPGEWEFDGVPPGSATLTINQNGNLGGLSNRAVTVSLSDGDTIDASVVGSSTAVAGRVTFPAPLSSSEQAQLLFVGPEQQTSAAPVRKDGTFSLSSLQPGTYQLHVSIAGTQNPHYVRSISATGAQVSGTAVTIPPSGSVHLSISVGSGAGAVHGVAKLAGKPQPGVMVFLVPASGQDIANDSRRDQSDSDGSFTLIDVIPGKYVLMAIANGWNLDWTNPAALKPYRDKGEIIEIAPGQTRSLTVDVQPLLK